MTKNPADRSVISAENYTYDAAGNLLDAPCSCFAYDTNNRLTSYCGRSVSYDMDGNMTNDGISDYTYDSANRLIAHGGNTYTYNAEDVRIQNGDTTYVYDTVVKLSRMLTKTENGVTTKYVYGLGLIGEECSTGFKTYHFDSRGSTIAITDAGGNLLDTLEYDTYGKLISHTGSSNIIFGYNGRDGVVTDDNGLIYMRARYYSPDMRRFINADIIAGDISEAITLNRFAYANGNPVSFVDPFGLSADERSLEIENISSDILGLADGIEYYNNKVKFIKQGDYLIIYGKNDFMYNDGIKQRRIRIDNLSKYPEIAKYVDPKQVFKSNFKSGFDAPGVILDVADIAFTTIYDVSQYEDVEDKLVVGAYDVTTGVATSVISTAASAGAVAVATKAAAAIGTAIAPGVGTVIGFAVGALVGWSASTLFKRWRKTVIEDVVRNN